MVNALSTDLFRYAYWLCRDKHTAEDLVQETFTRAWRAIDTLRDEKAAKQWLLTTLRREFARTFERRRPVYSDVDPEELESTEPGYDTRIEAQVLRRSLDKLPNEYLEPLLLQVLWGYSCEEIAEALGLKRGAVMTRLFRARQKMRELLTHERDKDENETFTIIDGVRIDGLS